MTIKLAFTGTGYIAKIHAAAAQKIPDVELRAVVNHQPQSTDDFAKSFGIQYQYATVEEMLAECDIDALSINTPNYLHAPQTIAALEKGVHVMVEKPMAMNAQEAERMLKSSEVSGALLMVAHCWRFNDEVRWLHEQVQAGKIGEVIRTKGYGVHLNWGPEGWFTQSKFAGGGAMADMGIHALDTARFLLGDPLPASVFARIGTYYNKFDVDDTGVVLVTWDNGANSYLESGWWQVHRDGSEASTQLYGTKGFGQVFPTYLDITAENRSEMNRIDPGFKEESDDDWLIMYDNQMKYFINCIQQNQKPSPGGEEGWINMQVVDAAYRSARSGEVVHFS